MDALCIMVPSAICLQIHKMTINKQKNFIVSLFLRLLVRSTRIFASTPWRGGSLVSFQKWPVPLQIRCGGHKLQPLPGWLLGLWRGGLQSVRLPSQLWSDQWPLSGQVAMHLICDQMVLPHLKEETHNWVKTLNKNCKWFILHLQLHK